MKKKLRTMDDVLLDGKEVLVRTDFNVTVGKDGVVNQDEDYRLSAALPTIEELMQRRCKVLLLTHLGRPGEEDGNLNLAPIHRCLEELLGEEVRQIESLNAKRVNAVVAGMDSGSVALLPNIREDEREMSRNAGLAKELAEMAEVYVNEAFSVSHRDHCSVALVPTLIPSCAGRRTVLEYEILSSLMDKPERPYMAIVSGAKVETKVAVINSLLKEVDAIMVGGRIANAFLAAKGYNSGEQHRPEDVEEAKKILAVAGERLILPIDVVVSVRAKDIKAEPVDVDSIPKEVDGVWDLGPKTIKHYIELCGRAKTVMWNGPVGMFEERLYETGTYALAAGLADLKAKVVVGGGDTVHALEKLKLINKFDHVSVGGGAMVAFLEGSSMPGLEPLLAA